MDLARHCYMLLHIDNAKLKKLLEEFEISVKNIPRYKLQNYTIDLIQSLTDRPYFPQFLERIDNIFYDNMEEMRIQDPQHITSNISLSKKDMFKNYSIHVSEDNMKLNIPYESLEEIIPPTVLIGNQLGFKRSLVQRKALINFNLSKEQLKIIAEDGKNEKNKRQYQLHVRICLLKPHSSEEHDNIPQGLYTQINCQYYLRIPLQNQKDILQGIYRKKHSINCTNSLLSLKSRNSICVTWNPDNRAYAIGMYIVKTSDFLINLVDDLVNNRLWDSEKTKDLVVSLVQGLIKKTPRSSEKTKNDIIKLMAKTESDLQILTSCVSLKCPLSMIRMQLPAVSVLCNHLQCFDAVVYITLSASQKNPKWKCPICDKFCNYEDIIIQSYFLEIIKNPDVADDVDEVELLSDGSWRVPQKMMDTDGPSSVNCVSLIEDDDDDDDYSKHFRIDCVYSLADVLH